MAALSEKFGTVKKNRLTDSAMTKKKKKEKKKLDKKKSNDLKIEQHKLHTKDRGERRFPRRISSSCPISCSHCVSPVQICVRH